jgi:hypothetical protein
MKKFLFVSISLDMNSSRWYQEYSDDARKYAEFRFGINEQYPYTAEIELPVLESQPEACDQRTAKDKMDDVQGGGCPESRAATEIAILAFQIFIVAISL